jgi:cell division protein FtsX
MEAIRSIRGNASIALAATATVLIAIATLGLFLAVFFWSQNQINNQKDKLDLRAYLKSDLTSQQVQQAIATVKAAPHVKDVTYKTAEQVLAEQKKINGAAIDLVGRNPYPPTLIIATEDPKYNQGIIDGLKSEKFLQKDKITPDGFTTDQDTTRNFLSAARILSWGAFGDADRGRHLVDRQHDPALDLRSTARGGGDAPRRGHQLVHSMAVHD